MEETLLTAARRVVRFFNVDQASGGSVSIETLKAMLTLEVQVEKEVNRQKKIEKNGPQS